MIRFFRSLHRSWLCFYANQHVYQWFTGRGFYCKHCLTRAPEWL